MLSVVDPIFSMITYDTSKFKIFFIKSRSSGRFNAKGASVPAAKLYWIVNNVVVEPSRIHILSMCISQNLSESNRTSSIVNAEKKLIQVNRMLGNWHTVCSSYSLCPAVTQVNKFILGQRIFVKNWVE